MTFSKDKLWFIRVSAIALAGTLGVVLLAGCKAESKMAPNEEANFKGGPMPADFAAKRGNPGGPPASVPKKP
ncbi:MAG: hypothetical protein EON59_18285 [Alphaproteobacteria bacterium]|nr:MAG: hypothetical protein EON59_18285 [Alphaproteobacteria bacterium]